MAPEFSGEVADLYARYRHGYPPEAVDAIVSEFTLDERDLAIDLGCGTGQLTVSLAARVRAVLAVDPEADMLAHARRAAQRSGAANITWVVGDDRELRATLGDIEPVGVLAVAQALHLMDHTALFDAARPLLRSGGGIAILSNGTPLWLQDSDWSVALRSFLERWLDTTLVSRCGTDDDGRRRYREALVASGYAVAESRHEHVAELDFAQLAGGVMSAMPVELLPVGERREAFLDRLRDAVGPATRFVEPVEVVVITGRR